MSEKCNGCRFCGNCTGTIETKEEDGIQKKALCMSSFCVLFSWQSVPVDFPVLEIINAVVFVNLLNLSDCIHIGRVSLFQQLFRI